MNSYIHLRKKFRFTNTVSQENKGKPKTVKLAEY